MHVDTKPIATYVERLLEVRREFTLFDDRVVVRARWRLKGEFLHVAKLATLRTETEELIIRYRVYRYAISLLIAGVVLFAVCHYSGKAPVFEILGYVAMAAMILGVTAVAVTYPNRRVRFVRFLSKSGRPGLDVGGAGNAPKVFEDFVKRIKRQISKA